MDKRYGHARDVSLLALLLERHGELAVRVRAGRGLGADEPVEHRVTVTEPRESRRENVGGPAMALLLVLRTAY